MNEEIILIEKPELKIQKSKDGIWLSFKDSKGRTALFSINQLAGHTSGIIDSCCKQWTEDYRKETDAN